MADKTGTEGDEDLLGTNTGDRLWGLAGNDRLYGNDGDDELWGGDGNDLLEGDAGADTMYGGAGDDTYRVDSTADVVSEESTPGIDDGGIDRVSTSITYTLGRFLEKLTLSGTAAIDGTGNELANLMIGNSAANTLVGLGGNDEIRGDAGDDWLIGGAGKDKLTGGTGADTFELALADAAGADSVLDFAAEDWVGIRPTDFGLAVGSGLVDNGDGTFALDPAYFATGTNGTAWAHGQFVYNTTSRVLKWDADGSGAGGGVSLATFNSGTVLSAADFRILGQAEPVVGTAGDDVLVGTSASETIMGLEGADHLSGGDGADQMNGGAGHDTLVVDNADTVEGGEGADAVFADAGTAAAGFRFALAGTNVEHVFASTGDDIVDASGTPATAPLVQVWGNDGDDTLISGAGEEWLDGGAGFDTAVFGGSFADYVVAHEGTNGALAWTGWTTITHIATGVTDWTIGVEELRFGDGTVVAATPLPLQAATAEADVITAGAAGEVVHGLGGADELTGGAGSDTLVGGAGADTLIGAGGTDLLYVDNEDGLVDGGAGYDYVYADDSTGLTGLRFTVAGSNVEYVTGNVGNDVIDGSGLTSRIEMDGRWGDDVLTGGAAADDLLGGEGNDTLRGNGGADLLFGEGGDDVLSGGTGGDLFSFGGAGGHDTITDFKVAEGDRIDLTAYVSLGVGSLADVSLTNNASGHAVIGIGGDTITLRGVSSASLDASRFLFATPVVGDISISDMTVTEGNSGTQTATFTVSRTGTAAFSIDWDIASGTATAGVDFDTSPATLTFAGGQTSQTISVTISGDTSIEADETFFVTLANATNGGVIADDQGMGLIANDDVAAMQPMVVAIRNTTAIGSPDPSGLAYVNGTLFLCDSEVNEAPFNSSNTLFALQTDGSLIGSYDLTGFTIEPTGLAYDDANDILYITDDDADRIYWVDPDAPNVPLGEFRTAASGQTDAEDVAFDPATGHLFISNGVYANIREVTTTGALVQTISLPSAIVDPEALLWDAAHELFFVGGRFSPNIWVLDRDGVLVETIDLLADYINPVGGRPHVADLELAPSSDPNDDPGKLSLYVADYGSDNVNDGRLFEIDLGNSFWA